MIKVSVIVPVYNCENTIESCLESILNQTLDEIQIIIINDGSFDNTNKILQKYLNCYSNKIKLINKDNEGQGKARNIGIDLAEGEFITFVDADDTIELNMLKKLYEIATKEKSDIVICDYYEITNGEKRLRKAIPQLTGDLKKDFIVWVAGPCNKIIKKDILKQNELYFAQEGIYEDIAMIPLVGAYANKIEYCEEPLYNYFIVEGSTMRQSTFNDKLLSIYSALEKIENGFIKSGYLKGYKEELEFIYIKHLLYAGSGRFLEYKEGRKEIPKIVQIIKLKYPKWKKNKYYKKQDILFKVNCNVYYTNCLWLIEIFQKIKHFIKKGK